MKIQKYTYSVLTLILLLSLTNCQDLNYDEDTGNTKEAIFNDIGRSKQFISGIYAYLPTDYGSIDNAMRSAATDEAEHVNDLAEVQKFNDGSWNAIQPLDDVWGNMYRGIRAVNVYLKEAEGQKFEDLQYTTTYANLIKQYNNYPYEARFLRAFFYFELAKRYKNVPIITTVLSADEAVNVEQAPFEEVVNYIVSECDAVATVLPNTYVEFGGASETGRATKGAALALKARVLLYAASPLHNPTNDIELWKKAASAAKDVIDLATAAKYSLAASYSSNFNMLVAAPTTEIILERRVAASNDFERRNYPIGYQGGGTGTCPTQNLVDAYEVTRSGLPIDRDTRYNASNPYNGRDPRLEQTVIRNNSTWKNLTVQSYFGGRNGLPLLNASKTSYYLKKFLFQDINLDSNQGAITNREHNWILFRYAEILLNYAEAVNEAFGPETAPPGGVLTARQAVNLVRVRAGMPRFPGSDNNATPKISTPLNQAEFRTKLRNERRVELAFEDHRFWDVRRWKIGNETKEIYGMKINEAPGTTFGFTFEKILLETRTYDDRMNLYPIPQSEIFRSNGKLKQNTGW